MLGNTVLIAKTAFQAEVGYCYENRKMKMMIAIRNTCRRY